jgi:predicted N-formylglutamate amidohydrolase
MRKTEVVFESTPAGIGTEAGQAAWADLLAPILESQMADAAMQTIEHH